MTILVRLTAAALPMVLCSWAALAADPIGDLAGYWTGHGSIALANGKTERVKCNVVYRSGGNNQIKQTMRCASSDYAINSLAELNVKGS